ncbi:MAG TPA: hypothetical protein VFQ91_05950 [Bryobacteraceae bacterium]|nr:hypothetical protein [Bryobacteraceae bacterium]
MTVRQFLPLAAVLCLSAQTFEVGVGSSSLDPAITRQFVNAFFRNRFSNLVSNPPAGAVRSFGGTGLIQEFNDASLTSGVKLALVKPNTSTASAEGVLDVLQVRAAVYGYYGTVGVSTAGFPVMDTAGCPSVGSITCEWQLFSKNYALFAYSSPLASGASTFTVKDVFYTEWAASGGIPAYGPATSAETAAASPAGTTATTQSFQTGMIVNVTSGSFAGRVLSVRGAIFATYLTNGGPGGFLGLPTGSELAAGTKRRQVFEGGAIEYEPGQPAVLKLPVASVSLSSSATQRMKVNDTLTVEAFPHSITGEELLDRTVAWVTTNGKVIAIQASGRTAVLKAVGGGVASVTAVSEGKTSPAISIFVQAPCCQLGEGAPSAAAAQAFADAFTRNRLTLTVPLPGPVRRVGNGYQQDATAAGGERIVIALPDRSAQAWILRGGLLAAYEQAGGAAGALGYPATDATAGGRQLFEGGALAGSPVQWVSGGILAKWAMLNYENGALGPPAGPEMAFATFAASSGVTQNFREGALFALRAGGGSGRTLAVTGPILSAYSAAGGANGTFGAPVNEEFTAGGRRRQDFEGGYMEYSPGGAVNAVESLRKPTISIQPAIAAAGSRIRLAAGGFPDNSVLRVSQTGQPDFLVRVANGAYAWDAWIPADSATRTVTVRATATAQAAVMAESSYQIRSAAESRPKLTKVRGDGQTGAPGASLPIPLRVNLKDENGFPLVGTSVTFAASPGASVVPRMVATDSNGDAEATLRLPPSAGIALATAEASRQVVTFSAQATGTSVSRFPNVSFTGNSYVAAAAAILQYMQDRGELPDAMGAVTPATVDSYLRNLCVLDGQANQICDGYLKNSEIANLWRLVNFAGGGLEVTPLEPSESGIRTALAAGVPVLVSLRLADGSGAAVAATGVSADGGIILMDPNPKQPRGLLSAYLVGQASVTGVLWLMPRAAEGGGFLLTTDAASAAVTSAAGSCRPPFAAAGGEGTTLFIYCDGSQPAYAAEIVSPGRYRGTLTDLTPGGFRKEWSGEGGGMFQISRAALTWEIGALEAAFGAKSVLNAASFAPDYAPGTAISIFGMGLGKIGTATAVEIGGQTAEVLFATPFQVNAVIPLTVPAGTWTLRVTSVYGTATAAIELRDTAPAIFRLAGGQAAVTNPDGTLNSPANPAARGQAVVMYGTGLGMVEDGRDGLRRATAPVTVRVNGVDLPIGYAGLTPGTIGLYQINVSLPLDMPPGLFLPGEISQGGSAPSAVALAIR